MSVLEEEITGDIYTQRSDDEELETIHRNQDEEVDAKTQTTGKKVFIASHLESRLPGQVLKIPFSCIHFIYSYSQSASTNFKSIFSNVNVQIA